KPGNGRPTSSKPGNGRPTSSKPGNGRPTSSKPGNGRPTSSKPGNGRPTSSKPGNGRPTSSKPSNRKPTTSKPKTSSKGTQKKNDFVLEQLGDVGDVYSSADSFGIEPGRFDGCSGWRSCVKDVVEEIVDNAADEAVDQIIDAVAPDLPVDSVPGLGEPGACNLRRPSSFLPGTPVLMADGSTKPIEQVRIGDLVVATDPKAGRTEAKPVTTLITGYGDRHLVKITVDIDGTGGSATDAITATDNHPFWLPRLGEWVTAGQLQPGMWLQTSAGVHVQVSAVRRWTATTRVHNLTVDELHTYHVLAGDQAILVHNDSPLSDDECFAIADRARDETREGMSNTQRRKHVMIVGAVDCVTGAVAVGMKRSEKGGSTHCAEDLARDDLADRGSLPENIRYGHPAHPDSMNEADFCARCRTRINPSQVPQDRRW
ncbi:polymorphic toxin-type HINT domain-containing protein, partial [Nonomuraea sp. NPDC049152]|uniref:polymorphic toxin-type HINT domain-containing protein n=1 Tax=Nonomuraea sp. NPDC049152 TaxID=3154350 RepID=UPI0033DB140F